MESRRSGVIVVDGYGCTSLDTAFAGLLYVCATQSLPWGTRVVCLRCRGGEVFFDQWACSDSVFNFSEDSAHAQRRL